MFFCCEHQMRMSKARSGEMLYTSISIPLACSIGPRELLISSTSSSTESLTARSRVSVTSM